MTVSLGEVRQAFDDLLVGLRTREVASAWACRLILSHDEDGLTFEPRSEEDRIWEAICFLGGVDSITPSGSYLYGPADFEHYKP